MGAAFNDIIMMIPAGAMRIIFGAFIFLVAHSINLGIGLLGAYVHSSRLQYVEFFGKFYEGGGVIFSPLKLKNEYIEIKGV
jgi:V/A-type H+-transporting ATPase subunit I